MKIRKWLGSLLVSVSAVFGAGQAQAGVPVFDAAAVAQAIAQVQSWTTQYNQMIQQIQQYAQQIQQMQNMTSKLDGARMLGMVLNDPSVFNLLPADMQNAASFLLNPTALTNSTTAINQVLSAFGLPVGIGPVGPTTPAPSAITPESSAANVLVGNSKVLNSTSARTSDLNDAKSQLRTSTDAKQSLDIGAAATIQTAQAVNDLIAYQASLENSRRKEELQRIANANAFRAAQNAIFAVPLPRP